MAPSVTDSPLRGRNSDPISHHPLRIATFSPPSQIFDASRAIREAVNHLDLAHYEPSVMAPPPSDQSKRLASSYLSTKPVNKFAVCLIIQTNQIIFEGV